MEPIRVLSSDGSVTYVDNTPAAAAPAATNRSRKTASLSERLTLGLTLRFRQKRQPRRDTR